MLRGAPWRAGQRRTVAIAATVLAHAVLVVAWHAALRVRVPAVGTAPAMVWLRLPQRVPAARLPAASAERATPARAPEGAGAARGRMTWRPPAPPAVAAPQSAGDASAAPAQAADARAEAAPADTPAVPAPAAGARAILERARRDAGAVDRTLRKENYPYIVAPPDSPQIRMRGKIDEAAALAPNRLWEAPKIDELVNDSGDGARRSRVITPGGAYCITERSPATSIDTIEKHGKLRITNCGTGHEQPARAQEWRTARD